jgi:hypothetical protein
MRLEFHPQIAADIFQIMDYYEDVVDDSLRTNSTPSYVITF